MTNGLDFYGKEFLDHDVTKPVFGVYNKVRLKPVSSATEIS